MSTARIVTFTLAFATLAPRLAAQCANGAAPPCVTPRPATPRDPPLEDRKWIVLPFANTAHVPDLDWVSTASVGLLYSDMSRWKEFRVVDDARVTDLLSEVPEATRTQLGLAKAIEIAKRAGAGRLVIGRFLRTGTRITLTAQVYDTRTQEPRTVADTALNVEAIPSAFSHFAARVLGVAPPPGITLDGLGTQSAEAVRAYTLGAQALNRARNDSAETHFRRAVELDSTFALAHLRLAYLYTNALRGRAADAAKALAAATLYAARLPEREQMIVAARQPNPGRAALCSLGGRLLGLDSADAEGWLALGKCHAASSLAVADAGGRVTGGPDLNGARRAFERALGALQPERWDAVQGLMDLYNPVVRRVCTVEFSPPATCPPESSYWGASVLDRDSIVVRFERVDRFNSPVRRREAAAGIRAMTALANDLAAVWTSANPRDIRNLGWYANWQLKLGNLAGAARALDASAENRQLPLNNGNRTVWTLYGVELALREMQPDRALPLLESLVQGPITVGNTGGSFMAAMGQFNHDVLLADSAQAVRAVRIPFLSAYAGVIPEGFEQIMQAYAAVRPAQRQPILEVGTLLAFHSLRTRPATDTVAPFSLFRYQAFIALGDTSRARRALAEYDAWGDAGAEDYFDGHELFSAESHLELGDTLTAWARIEPFGRRWAGYSSLSSSRVGYFWDSHPNFTPALRVTGRAWLLYADLAMATGHRDEAHRGYKMIAGMWEHGDPPVQPLVHRAKVALAKLGGP